MGAGHYGLEASVTRSFTENYASKSVKQVFTETSINEDMDPSKMTIREACDSEDHPEALPIIIALDVTGSMGNIPHHLITEGLTKIMGNIMQNGINDAAVCFLAIGDHECDSSPLQIGQFEAADDLLDKWLKSTYIEEGGGGNAGESYMLAWLAGGRLTKTDHFDKRGQKGLLFTIGDEPCLPTLPASAQLEILGNGSYEDVSSDALLKEASEKYECHHILVTETYAGSRPQTQKDWQQRMKDRCHPVDSYKDIPSKIARLIAEHCDVKDVVITESIDELKEKEEERTNHL